MIVFFVNLQGKTIKSMKELFMIMVIAFAVLCTGCKGDSSLEEEGPKEPFFYVRYNGYHSTAEDFDETCTMTITDENGLDVSYTIGSQEVLVGPVYAGFTAKMTITAPDDGENNGSICIARIANKTVEYEYASFANSKETETLTYTIHESTGKEGTED